jgi:hypothetical protein
MDPNIITNALQAINSAAQQTLTPSAGFCARAARECMVRFITAVILVLVASLYSGWSWNSIWSRNRGSKEVLEVLVKVDVDQLPDELRRLYVRYGVKFQDDPKLEDCEDVVRRHLEYIEKGK